ncbi:MAG: HAMP domain-containing protein, partial [Verrucomicrobia bacterium]|nr:HAMP domain-containing protein [Verrucomicrobiota bacterium]
MKLSIRAKLILGIGVPLLVVYGVMSGVEYERASRLAVARTQTHLGELTRRYAAELDARLTLVAEVVHGTADFMTLQPTMGAADIRRVLEANMRGHVRIFASGVFFEPETFQAGVRLFGPYVHRSADGRELAYMDFTGGTGYDYTQSGWYVTPKQRNQPSWSEPYFDAGAGNIVMCTHSAPFYRDGKFRGVVTADISLEDLRKELAGANIEGGGYCGLVSSLGTFISHPDASLVMKETVFSAAEKLRQPEWAEIGRDVVASKSGVRRTVNRDGEPTYMAFAPVRSTGWSFGASIPVASVMAPAVADLHRDLCVLAVGLALILSIVLVVSIRMTGPISLLAASAEKLGRGDLEVRVTGITSGDEIGDLAATFNTMVAQLKESIEARVREESARRAVESELRVARRIQAEMMPHVFPAFPDRTEFDLHALNEPAEYVAGDFYDFFFVNDHVLALVMADVSGKGMP